MRSNRLTTSYSKTQYSRLPITITGHGQHTCGVVKLMRQDVRVVNASFWPIYYSDEEGSMARKNKIPFVINCFNVCNPGFHLIYFLDDYNLMGWFVVEFRKIPTLQLNIQPPTSRSKTKPSKKLERQRASSYSLICSASNQCTTVHN
jgi:hypothetical protein